MSCKIPKLIHQVWFNFTGEVGGGDIGEHNRLLRERVRAKNPNYRIHLWREKESEELIKKSYPQYWSTYLFLDPIIRKVDYLRFFLLHKYGGIYLDVDYFVLQNFDKYFTDYPQYKDSDIVLSRSCYGPWITNSILMSGPGRKFWKFCMDQVKNGALVPWWGNLQSHIETSCTTGPHFMTMAYEAYMKTACGPEKFTIEEPPLFVAQEFSDSVYAWHEGQTSWIKSEDFLTVEWLTFLIIIVILILRFR